MKRPSIAFLRYLLTSAAIVFLSLAAVAHTDDNVFIADGIETWQFIPPKGDKPACVKNTITHHYEATRYPEVIHPFAFYDNRTKLTKANADGKARHESASSRNVFHDDNKVCYYDISLNKVGKRSKVIFERTLTDPVFFCRLFLAQQYPIKNKEVHIIIPAEYPQITVDELNFTSADGSEISRTVQANADGGRTYVYRLTNLPGTEKPESEKGSPFPLLYQPVVLVKGWFNSVDSLCNWHTGMSDIDTEIPDIDSFLATDVYGAESSGLSPRERLERIYAWVQHNIRYIAYEEGESGHRPDKPAEVIRKRYGDCKGMAMLLATLLCHEGIDAHAAVIGTDDIPFKIAENPSLAATNHSICIAIESGDTLYLDATNEHIPASHIPDALQGKDAIVLPSQTDNHCRLINIPMLPAHLTALDSICYTYSFTPERDALTGNVTQTLSGDLKEIYLSAYTSTSEKNVKEKMARTLTPLKHSKISENITNNYNAGDGKATIEAEIVNNEAVTDASPLTYIDLNANNVIPTERIDNTDRRSPYRLPTRGRIVRNSKVKLPAGAKVSHLPDNYSAVLPQAKFSCTFSTPEPGVIELNKSVEITERILPVDGIEQWNKTLSEWENACKNQIEISFE